MPKCGANHHNWSIALIGFKKRLTTIDTSPLLCHHILEELEKWREGSEPQQITEIPPALRPAILEQRKIGWKEFLEGLVSSYLHIYQQEFYTNKESYKTASTWGSAVIRAGSDVVFQMWDERNKKIHDTPILAELEGEEKLNNAIV